MVLFFPLFHVEGTSLHRRAQQAIEEPSDQSDKGKTIQQKQSSQTHKDKQPAFKFMGYIVGKHINFCTTESTFRNMKD